MAKTCGGVRGVSSPTRVIPSINTSAPISSQIKELIGVALSNSPNRTQSIEIASVENRLKKFAAENGIKIAGDKIILTRKNVGHTFRNEKVGPITHEELATFPERMTSMRIFYDRQKKNFLYFDGYAKYVIEPNKTKGKGKTAKTGTYYITASRATSEHFSGRRFTEIK